MVFSGCSDESGMGEQRWQRWAGVCVVSGVAGTYGDGVVQWWSRDGRRCDLEAAARIAGYVDGQHPQNVEARSRRIGDATNEEMARREHVCKAAVRFEQATNATRESKKNGCSFRSFGHSAPHSPPSSPLLTHLPHRRSSLTSLSPPLLTPVLSPPAPPFTAVSHFTPALQATSRALSPPPSARRGVTCLTEAALPPFILLTPPRTAAAESIAIVVATGLL
ncbi:hypothetical protein Syun_027224 [Stephania yunnanensis]|uniref:Uncharacterized protein n=1 Tax=Stephania yunnanensis TaxID=152371 RepID=A0AAP0EKP8_9MAGN